MTAQYAAMRRRTSPLGRPPVKAAPFPPAFFSLVALSDDPRVAPAVIGPWCVNLRSGLPVLLSVPAGGCVILRDRRFANSSFAYADRLGERFVDAVLLKRLLLHWRGFDGPA